jgi:hypothetical protein
MAPSKGVSACKAQGLGIFTIVEQTTWEENIPIIGNGRGPDDREWVEMDGKIESSSEGASCMSAVVEVILGGAPRKQVKIL